MRSRTAVVFALALCAATSFADEGGVAECALVVPSARFILQLGVLVFAAKVGGRLFDRWRLPKVQIGRAHV